MDSLDWDYEVTEVLFLRKFEEESIVWFRCWLEKVDEGKTLFFFVMFKGLQFVKHLQIRPTFRNFRLNYDSFHV